MSRGACIRIVEVGPRDGLQNEVAVLPPATRIALIKALAAAGLTSIEAGSFVSPKLVPQLADTAQVLAGLVDCTNLRLPVLVPNAQGLAAAIAAGAREIAIFASASETFSQHNIRRSIDESLTEYRHVAADALAAGIKVRGYVSCVLGCPYEGKIAPSTVVRVATDLIAMGCAEVSLGDTIGIGTPDIACALVRDVAAEIGVGRVALHFHDTYGQALANVLACLDLGVSTIDAAVAGLGGCPFAPASGGNLATEDLVYMLDGLGLPTGIALDRLISAGEMACQVLGASSHSRAARALRRHHV
ncbi:MAG: hydroxymethylglutaryl-CoA lyase [Paracoccaceae bacterium]